MNKLTCICNAIIFGILLNLLLSAILQPFATPDEIRPPLGPENLSYKSQFMHMMVHHKKVPFISSFIIVIVVGLSIYLGYLLDPCGFIYNKIYPMHQNKII